MKIPILLKPHVTVRDYSDLNHSQMLQLVKSYKKKKYGFLLVAYDVVEKENKKYDVRMEYMIKDL